ncbi:unnamed protein product [Ilex paraguariensis]|uniref:Peptidase metallopeptidase domain-containing protein n=1 Tax=Ilex paraguariensis TaxID=185542 RepID=A0ABC8TK11_9AQUA
MGSDHKRDELNGDGDLGEEKVNEGEALALVSLVMGWSMVSLDRDLGEKSRAHLSEPNEKTPSAFEFIKHLKGSRNGDKVDGLHKLKTYLKNFGYLSLSHSKLNQTYVKSDVFDHLLESAIKTYQLNYNLEVTGELDSNTVSMMTMPRCGIPDIINGTTRMRSGNKMKYHYGSNLFQIVSHYSFFPGKPKWPRSKAKLTYAFLPGTHQASLSSVGRAFSKWASVSSFRFSQTENYKNADLKIAFYSGNHGDGVPFEGPGGILAHAFAPTDGRLHFDADERWSDGVVPGLVNLESVALHEIGHLLGLGHSSVNDAIMFPTIPPGVSKNLALDDIKGLKDLYS